MRPAASAERPAWTGLGRLTPTWLASAWLVSKAQWFWRHRPDLEFGWIVLVLAGYLFWEAWERRPPFGGRLTPTAVVLAGAAVGLCFLAQVYQAAFGLNPPVVQGLGLGVLLLALANLRSLFTWPAVWPFAGAFAFLFLALPMPSILFNPLVSGLQAKVAGVDVSLLNLLGVPAQQVGSLIHLPRCTVGIDEACSGVRSLQSTVMATLFIGYLALRHNGLRVLLLAAGVGLAFLGNVGRSLWLSLAAHRGGHDALARLHDTAGWSILLFTMAGVALLAWACSRVERRMPVASSNPLGGRPPADHESCRH